MFVREKKKKNQPLEVVHLLYGCPLLYGHVQDRLLTQGKAAALGGSAALGRLLLLDFLGPAKKEERLRSGTVIFAIKILERLKAI